MSTPAAVARRRSRFCGYSGLMSPFARDLAPEISAAKHTIVSLALDRGRVRLTGSHDEHLHAQLADELRGRPEVVERHRRHPPHVLVVRVRYVQRVDPHLATSSVDPGRPPEPLDELESPIRQVVGTGHELAEFALRPFHPTERGSGTSGAPEAVEFRHAVQQLTVNMNPAAVVHAVDQVVPLPVQLGVLAHEGTNARLLHGCLLERRLQWLSRSGPSLS